MQRRYRGVRGNLGAAAVYRVGRSAEHENAGACVNANLIRNTWVHVRSTTHFHVKAATTKRKIATLIVSIVFLVCLNKTSLNLAHEE